MITQRYHSLEDLEPEFIAPLEELMIDQIPSFQSLLATQRKSELYLFFTDDTNAPMGVALFNKSQVKRSRFTPFKQKEKFTIKWQGMGRSHCSLFVSPKYKSLFIKEAQKVFAELQSRRDINTQEIYSNEKVVFNELEKVSSENIVNTLFKNSESFSEHLNHTPKSFKSSLIKELKENANLKFSSHSNLKDAFAYKKEHRDLYKQIREDLKAYTEARFFTIEKDNELLLLISLIQGQPGHIFYSYKELKKGLSQKLILAFILMAFYEQEEANFLHPLIKTRFSDTHQSFGFGKESEEKFKLS